MIGRFSNALEALLALQNAVDSVANRNEYFDLHTTSRGAYPSVDLFQHGDDAILTAELPGVKKEDIKLEIKDNLIRISGERKIEYPEKVSVHRLERRNTTFDRTFRLPHRVELDKVNAEYKDGVLKIRMPRAENDKPKQIKVA